jgi:signal transduction histidine kinase
MSTRARAGLLAGAVAAAGFKVAVTLAPPQPSPTNWTVVTSAVTLAFLAAGLAASERWPGTRLGLLFSVTGYTFLLPQAIYLPGAFAFTLGIVTMHTYNAALAHLGLAWPTGRLRSRSDRALVIVLYCWNTGSTVVGNFFWNPKLTGCQTCPANLVLVHGSNNVLRVYNEWVLVPGLTLSMLVLIQLIRHWRVARGWSRRAMTALLWVGVPLIALSTIQSLQANLNLQIPALDVIGPALLLAGPALFVISTLFAKTARGAIGAAIISLEPGAPPGKLRDTLAAALGDSTLQLAFPVPGDTGFADTVGTLVDPAAPGLDRVVTPLPGPDCAILVYDAALEHEPALIRLTAAAAGLALEHSRLQVEVAAQLEQVRASRARIVEVGDAERRRLERDLHDGAQQRLVTLSLALAMARDRAAAADPSLAALIESAAKEAKEALVELRELARGIHPAVLTETGLRGAVQALVERLPVATEVTAMPSGRFPAPAEAAAYFVIAEALTNVVKHAKATCAQVAVSAAAGRLTVEVTDDGGGGARLADGTGLRGLADRVAAAGGVLRVESPSGGGTHLMAEIPCQ